ncbi:HIT family protein [Lapidilactobacillus wuchangensis]|uniref:HIT family protein n=1 Tax=Lapidilactobacillus wuchangensis TaxID=2486001 RepID=UPI000F77C8FA|nr:HIT domain-containing protein [Lapidilactobacillus wuchangensis]
MVMAVMSGGFATFGDIQFLPGYSVLLPKRNVASLNDLSLAERAAFLTDMSLLGDALLAVTKAQRINYDILGNTDNFLHAHVFPRYETEAPERLRKPVWLYSADHWSDEKYQYNPERDDELRHKITQYLEQRLEKL